MKVRKRRQIRKLNNKNKASFQFPNPLSLSSKLVGTIEFEWHQYCSTFKFLRVLFPATKDTKHAQIVNYTCPLPAVPIAPLYLSLV